MIVLHSITVVCPRLLTVGDSVVLFFFSFLFFFLFNFIRCPCNVFDLLTYLLTPSERELLSLYVSLTKTGAQS